VAPILKEAAENYEKGIIDHKIRVSVDEYGRMEFYIHADGYDSDTLDYVIDGNRLDNKY
jgi:hypothetical protein